LQNRSGAPQGAAFGDMAASTDDRRWAPRARSVAAIAVHCATLVVAIAGRYTAAAATMPAAGAEPSHWLADHPAVAEAITWEAPDGTVAAYPQWPAEMQAALQRACAAVMHGESTNVPEAPPLARPTDASVPFPPLNPELARWPAEIARDTLLAYVAQSLAVEIARAVPWSLTDYSPRELAPLLASRSLYVADPPSGTYRIPYNAGAITPGDPVRIARFLAAHQLLAPTARGTIERVVDWIAHNVVHFTGDWDAANVYTQWHYYGWPPAERILAGTVNDAMPSAGAQRRSGACFGTVGLLHTLLRTVNIPVELLHPCPGHGVPYFVHEGLYLSHGDDPYDTLWITTPPLAAAELFIDDAQYERWLATTEVSITRCKNVGRQVRELALRHLSNELMQKRCRDRAAGIAPDASEVYQVYRFDYPLAALDQQHLWQRLDEKIDRLGGCAKVPPAHW
jgi:hypothetical protein